MDERFADLTRAVAAPQTRRGVLKALGGATVAAAAATLLKPFRADAACASGETPCGDACCPSGTACVNASTGTCGCPAGTVQCGTRNGQPSCCTGTCANPSTNCCCAKGTTPCGKACCAKGVACVDTTNGICGCPSGYTSCGTASNTTCCPAGQACNSPNCQPVASFTGTNRVASACGECTGQTCANYSGGCNGDSNCICTTLSDGSAFCKHPQACGTRCNSATDCPSGSVCVTGTCCGYSQCQSLTTHCTSTSVTASVRGPGTEAG